ncbi:histidine kinase [Maribacter sp.]|nr:histidine kinase [Maribacter sp.]
MLKFLDKNIFWVIQLFGWGAMGLLTAFGGGQDRHFVDAILLFMSTLISGVITTSILRWYLKRYITLSKISLKKALKVLGAVLTASFLWLLLLFALGSISAYLIESWEIPKERRPSQGYESKIILYFLGFALMSVWTGLYFGIRMLRKFNAERIERLELRERVRQAQLNTLKGHINAQFMVETLKKIKKLMLTDVPTSRSMLTELSELLRYSLTKDNINRVALIDEIEMVENYVRLTSLDHREHLKASYKLPSEVDISAVEVPPMLIVTLVEFFIKQGDLRQLSNGKLDLDVTLENGYLVIYLKSNATSLASKENEFLRQKLEQRLALLYKNAPSMEEKHNDEGTSIQLYLPLDQPESNL